MVQCTNLNIINVVFTTQFAEAFLAASIDDGPVRTWRWERPFGDMPPSHDVQYSQEGGYSPTVRSLRMMACVLVLSVGHCAVKTVARRRGLW